MKQLQRSGGFFFPKHSDNTLVPVYFSSSFLDVRKALFSLSYLVHFFFSWGLTHDGAYVQHAAVYIRIWCAEIHQQNL